VSEGLRVTWEEFVVRP